MLATLPHLAKAGYEPCVACPPQGDLAGALRDTGIAVVGWNDHANNEHRPALPQRREELAVLLTRHAPDLVHANSLSMSRLSGPVLPASDIPSVGHLRDIINLSQQAVRDLNEHRQLLAVSQATKDHHVGQGLCAARCTVLHNGVDLNQLQPRPRTGYLQQELRLPSDSRLIVTIGQIGLRKATDVALKAVQTVVASDPTVHWLVVGERTSDKAESRQLEADLLDAAKLPSLAGHVHWLGTRDDVPRLLAECDLLLHAARQEPLGRVLLESAAAGLPVVATDVGGTREIFPTSTDGAKLVPVDDHAAMANRMFAVLSDDNLRQTLAQGARRRAEAAFGIDRAAANLIDQYELVLGERI